VWLPSPSSLRYNVIAQRSKKKKRGDFIALQQEKKESDFAALQRGSKKKKEKVTSLRCSTITRGKKKRLCCVAERQQEKKRRLRCAATRQQEKRKKKRLRCVTMR